VSRKPFSPFSAFRHALHSLYYNRVAAFRMSWPWMLILAPFTYFDTRFFKPLLLKLEPGTTSPEIAEAFVRYELPYLLVSGLSFASIAVNWHRYILRDELAQGLQRLRLDAPVWRYLFNLALVVVILVLVMLLPTVVVSLASSLFPPLTHVGMFLIVVLAVVVSFRLSVKFPAIAVENHSYSFAKAYQQTKGMTLPIATYGALTVLTSFFVALIVSLPQWLAAGAEAETSFWLSFILQFCASWVMLIFGITVLTSLYGYFEEGRDY
jgi:hypothetical protein